MNRYFQSEVDYILNKKKQKNMIKEVHPEMVLIKPDAVEEVTKGGIITTDDTKEKLMKQQNRGIVENVGDKCIWAKKGDYISFYRAAGTDIDGLVLVHENHCLVKYEKAKK